jgi:hypothetical protein
MGQSVFLWNVPRTPEEWATWSLNHRLSHQEIIQAVLTQKSISLFDYTPVLDPINFQQVQSFLEANSELHIDMTRAVGIASHDIQDVDLKNESQLLSFINVHALEHRDVEQILGI